MKTYKVGLIRVLTTEDEELLQLHGKLIESYFPMFQVVSRCIPEQPEGIHDDETFAVGVPKVVNLAVELGLTQGYMQEKSSAKEEYTPSFNLEGVEDKT